MKCKINKTKNKIEVIFKDSYLPFDKRSVKKIVFEKDNVGLIKMLLIEGEK